METCEVVHRTRNALVAEFKENNIMTRKRQSLDQIKSPTQRIEQLKKLTPTLNKSSRNSSTASSPSVTPLPKRRSVSDRSSPIPINLKMLSENAGRTTTKTATAAAATATQQKSITSKIPKRAAATTTSSRLTTSPTKGKVQSSQTRSRLPLRKSNRSSQGSSRKK